MLNTGNTATDVTITEPAENVKGFFYRIYLEAFRYILNLCVLFTPIRFISFLVVRSDFLMPTCLQHLAWPWEAW